MGLMCTYVETGSQLCHPQNLTTLLLRHGFLLNPEFTDQLDWLDRKPKMLSYLYFPSAGTLHPVLFVGAGEVNSGLHAGQ